MSGLRILIVEDDAMIAMFLADTLEGMGHEVCATVESEADTLVAADRYQPDLMIVDAGLRDGSGVAAVDRILRTRDVPHFFVTGNPQEVRLQRPGATVIQKPFFLRELKSAIEAVTKAARLAGPGA